MQQNLTLSQLTLLIQETVNIAFSEPVFVVAEINSLNVNISGHAYLELIEKDTNTNKVIAKMKGIIWARTYRLLNDYFTEVTGTPLRAGIKILAKVLVDFHPVYGLSLKISDIDPNYTVGEWAKQREEVIRRLTEEGIIDMNKQLEFPLVPQKIAIISSPTAAGYEDFINQLENNPYGYKFFLKLFPAVMQGDETSKSVIAALEAIFEEIDEFDIAVIIRGGGSKLDLSAFDDYNLAVNIAQFPLPVITGIGHERDLSVADIVAHKSLKTPTAVANFIIDKTFEFENQIIGFREKIKYYTNSLLESHIFLINRLKNTLYSKTFQKILDANNNLNYLNEKLKTAPKQRFFNEKQNLKNLASKIYFASTNILNKEANSLKINENKLKHKIRLKLLEEEKNLGQKQEIILRYDPVTILEKGFALIYKNGKIVKRASQIAPQEIVEINFSDGTAKSQILEIRKSGKND